MLYLQKEWILSIQQIFGQSKIENNQNDSKMDYL